MALFALITTGFLALATLLPMFRLTHWSVRAFDFPRVQLLCLMGLNLLLVALLVGYGRLLGVALGLVTLIAMGWQAWWILPYTRFWSQEVETADPGSDETRLRIMTSNVLMTNRDSSRLLALVRKHRPDVLVTLETDQWWQEQLAPLEKDMLYTLQCPLDNLYGMHVYSRLPLQDPQIDYLVEDKIPSMSAMLILENGTAVRTHFLHPAPPSPTENTFSSERDAELIVVASALKDETRPVVVTGDLNDVAWSPTTRLFRKLSGLLDPRIGRGMVNTFHTQYPFMRWPLDHLFHSDHFAVGRIGRLEDIGSDHFPLLVDLVLRRNHSEQRSGIDADAEDRALADEIAEEEGVDEGDVPKPQN